MRAVTGLGPGRLSLPPALSPSPAALPPRSLSADVPEVGVLEQELAWLKEHLPPLDSPVVFCHNDLLCKNIIYDSSKGTAARPGGSRPSAVLSAASGCHSSGWCGASEGRPSGVGLKLICRREVKKKQIPG